MSDEPNASKHSADTPEAVPKTLDELSHWLKESRIDEVECLVPDSSGVARGKIIPCNKFISGFRFETLKIPDGVFAQMVTGDYIDDESCYTEEDRNIVPDPSTVRIVPWYKNPTAQIICDVKDAKGQDVLTSPRAILRRVLNAYQRALLRPLVSPEIELYFIEINKDPDIPLRPPLGLSKRRQVNRQAYGIDAANEFDPVVNDIYDFAEKMRLNIDTFSHEVGAGQVEFNFNHGDPLKLADQVFLFKRMARQAAFRHDIYATFMAKPHQYEAGSAMHIHSSVYDIESQRNIFATPRTGNMSKRLSYFVGGLQRHVGAAMAFYAPNVNSYRRISYLDDIAINSHWGVDNRSVGFRIPSSPFENLRVENRIPGADSNPYLVIAVSLACGLIGLQERIEASPLVKGNASRLKQNLPQHIFDSVSKLSRNQKLINMLNREFVHCYCQLKREEFNKYHQVISSWERENLLLNV